MGSYADIKLNGHELDSWKNTYDEWYFAKTDRVREIVNDEDMYDSRNFIGYRTNVFTIRKRLKLAGYDLKSAERDFEDTRTVWIKDMKEMLSMYQEDIGSNGNTLNSKMIKKISSQLEIVQTASFHDWKAALPISLSKASTYSEQIMLEQDVHVENDPLLSLILSPLAGVYDEHMGFAGSNFPSMDINSYAILLLDMSDDGDVCELNVSNLIFGGWIDDFGDIAQIQANETVFHEHFRLSLDELSTLSNSMNNETLQRMVFASVISTMEAYLSDTIKQQVLNRLAIKRRFVKYHKSFNKNIKELEIFEFLDRLDERLIGDIDKISFHNIEIVIGLYQSVLLCEFPKDKISKLSAAVKIRHDIVHRNGKKTDGSMLVTTQQDVSSLIGLVQKVIRNIDLQIINALLQD